MQKEKKRTVKMGIHTIEIRSHDNYVLNLIIDGIRLAVFTGYNYLPDEVCVFTENVKITDYCGNKDVILKDAPIKKH